MNSERALAVAFEQANVGYGRAVVLSEVTFSVNKGQLFAVVGPNGSGKTTLLRTLLGINRPIRGVVARYGRMGYVPQRQALDDLFPFTSEEVVSHGLIAEQPSAGEGRSRVLEVLKSCGVEEFAGQPFRTLSGGQKQRVLIARALVTRPDTLVLDEPTNDLDIRGEHDVLKLVKGVHLNGTTVVMVSHDLDVVASLAEQIAFISEGRLVVGSREAMLTPERLEALYGVPIDLTTGRPRLDWRRA